MKPFQYTCSTALLLSVIIVSGCSDATRVSGKVVMTDGSPISKGIVSFSKGDFNGTGNIQADGTYKLGGVKDGEGVPPGKYTVTLRGIVEQVPGKMVAGVPVVRSLVDETFSTTCEVGEKTMTFDISVPPNPKK